MSGFSIVMAAYMVLTVAWIMGVVNALRGKGETRPRLRGWGERMFAIFCRRKCIKNSI